MSDRPLLRRTSLRRYVDGVQWHGFAAAVSLHAHTCHSREVLSDFPEYIVRIPWLGARFESELNRRRARDEPVDFTRGWWHPPISPRGLLESEAGQIDRRFGIDWMVSVTDHDSIQAGFDAQRWFAPVRTPISLEWTVPFYDGFFHLGVHDLPAASAREWFDRLSSFTDGRSRESLIDLLQALNGAGTLVVFNHPLWDLAGVGEEIHAARLREFLDRHQSLLHAVEINGYRSRRENGGVRRLSSARGLPLISGGDRHGLSPNALLNLTHAASFAEFAAEVRDGVSHVVIMPEYQEHLAGRIIASVGDVLRTTRGPRPGRQRWTDRVTVDADGAIRTLSHYLPDGGPWWVRTAVAAARVATAPSVFRLWRPILGHFDEPATVSPIPTTS